MTIGTFLGAVWANESWGRYWGWEPERNMGIDYDGGLCRCCSPSSGETLVQRLVIQSVLGRCFLIRIDDILRSELFPERHALLWTER